MFGQKTDNEKAEGYKKTLAAKLAASRCGTEFESRIVFKEYSA